MDWARERERWPNAAASRFVETRAARWHVQEAGAGPAILLLHGAGGATHSWRGILPRLAAHARVIAPDLPGHGFTRPRATGRTSLPAMAEDVAALLAALDAAPVVAAGHSAGAAILLRMALDGASFAHVVGLNPALRPFEGMAGTMMPALARLTALNPFAPWLVAQTAGNAGAVRTILGGLGGAPDAETVALYRRLAADPDHVDGTLRMMARWDLAPLLAALPRLATPVTFALGGRDRAVPPAATRAIAARMPRVALREYPEHGHLMHEEAPETFAALVLEKLETAHE